MVIQTGISSMSNIVERSFYDLKTTISNLGRSATGRSDMIDTKRVLRDIKAVRAQLDALEAATIQFTDETKAVKRAERHAALKADRRLASYLAKNPDQIARAQQLGINLPASTRLSILTAPAPERPAQDAVEGLVVMARAHQNDDSDKGGKVVGLRGLFSRKAA